MKTKASIVSLLTLALLTAVSHGQESRPTIDQRSYNLGVMGGFAEVVRLGVKKLALSEVMTPDEMDGVMEDAEIIAKRNEVLLWRETDFLVTDLFPEDVAKGKKIWRTVANPDILSYVQRSPSRIKIAYLDSCEQSLRFP